MDLETILGTAVAAAIANQILQHFLHDFKEKKRRKEDEMRQAFELSNRLIMLAIRYDNAIYENELHNEDRSGDPFDLIFPQEPDVTFMELTRDMIALDKDILSAISEIDIMVATARKRHHIESFYDSFPPDDLEKLLHRMRACRDKCAAMANRLRSKYSLPKLPKNDWESGDG